MGLDGFSMGNLGLNNDLTSAQMANQAEQLAKKGSEFKIKDVTQLSKEKGVKRKESEPEGKKQFDDGFKNKKNDDDDSNNNEEQLALIEKSFENKNPREFSVRINPETELIELFNNKTDKVLETINAQNLMGLVSKMNNASGILVNRKI